MDDAKAMDDAKRVTQVSDDGATGRTSWAGSRRWRLPAALLSGLIASGAVIGTVSATAASPSASVIRGGQPVAAVPSAPAGSSTAAEVEAAVLQGYPGATVLAISGNAATGYIVQLATADRELMAVRVVLGDEQSSSGAPATGTAQV